MKIESLVSQIERVIKRTKDRVEFPIKVIEYTSVFPTIGEVGVEYVFENKIYSWDEVNQVYYELLDFTKSKPDYLLFHNSSYIEIESILKTFKDKNQKFPLIFFNSEKTKGKLKGDYSEVTIGQIIIATKSDPSWTSDIRESQNFSTILRPLANMFIDSLRVYGFISINTVIEYKEHFFYGKDAQYGNSGHLFSDYVDAIEINNLKLILKNNC